MVPLINRTKKALRQAPQPPSQPTFTVDYKDVLDRIPGLVTVYNLKTGHYLYVNTSVKNLLGYSAQEFLTKGIGYVMSLVHADDVPGIIAKNTQALKEANKLKTVLKDQEIIVDFEYRLKHKDGSYRWLHTDGSVFSRDKKGKVDCILNISLDITHRKEAEERVDTTSKETMTLFNTFLNSSPLGIGYLDHDLKYVYVNQTLASINGVSVDKTLGRSLEEVIPQLAAEVRPVMEGVLKSGKPMINYEVVGQTSATPQKTRYWLVNYLPIISLTEAKKDHNAKLYGIGVIVMDITDRKLSEQRLRDSEERYRLVVENAHDVITLLDANGSFIYVSPSIEKILGYKPLDLLGNSAFDLFHPDDKLHLEHMFQKVLTGQGIEIPEFRVKNKKGDWMIMEGSSSAIYDESGKPILIVSATRDITERKLLEKQKDDFMGIVSHELKTPVTTIKAFTQVLYHRFALNQDKTSQEMLQKMNIQIDKLNTLISDLLDITKIEGGKLRFNDQLFDFDDLVMEVVDEVQHITPTHVIEIQGKIRQKIHGDRDRIGQVITNLLTNAIKYSPKANKVIVSVEKSKTSLILSVKDFGVGISKDKQPFVFDRFFRETGGQEDTFPGLGLGLYISKEIIQRCGGDIGVKSQKGKGSTFYFTLPFKKKAKM